MALPELDLELTAMLSRAVESIGLHRRPPPSPERSRLDDWFLGAQAACRQPPPGPFFPVVHEKVTRSWRALKAGRLRDMWRSPHLSALLRCSFAGGVLPPGAVIHASRPGLVGSQPLYRAA